MYELAIFSSSSINFSPSPCLPPEKPKQQQKKVKRNKTPRILVLFHLFPEGTTFCLLSFPRLVVESFPLSSKPWQPHLVALLVLLGSEKGRSLGSDWLTPFPTLSFSLIIRAGGNNVVLQLAPSGYWIDSFVL